MSTTSYQFAWAVGISLLLVGTLAAPASAQGSSVTLDTTIDGTSFLATITSTTTTEDCAVDLYGAPTTEALSVLPGSAKLIASTELIDGTIQIPARKLLPLRVKKAGNTASVFFRTRATCGGVTQDSNVTSILLLTSRRKGVPGAAGWLRHLNKQVVANSFKLVDATPGFNFDRPVDIQYPRDGTNRLFVVEQSGKIYLVKTGKSATKTLFLDIGAKIKLGGNLGLLSMAFHPKFSQNGQFFVHYSNAGDGNTVIARYSLKSGSKSVADTTSEKRILEIVQSPTADHVGGQITFGDDGFLYIALGDGGSGAMPVDTSRKLTNLYGKVLRIDVDSPSGGREYGIPSNNPFGDEIWAYGLRNPFKISFDRTTGRLWAGDVGQDGAEEVDIIESGKHYGWNTLEGTLCYSPPTGCDATGTEAPVTQYSHLVGLSITGGYVYRGSKIKPLQGFYLYGDFINGKLFGLSYGDGPKVVTLLANTEEFFSTFGLDRNNELYVAGYTTGKVFRFTKR